uniref:EGF-like domain-containing protein n=1 Tax=Cuerna arida TaxID=1464854 RepID=A0A1B6FV61_9HEMI
MPLFTIIISYQIMIVLLLSSFTASERDLALGKESDKQLTTLKLPPCQACKMVVESFIKGMERTARNHFGGGDTAWEEKNLGSYATSEVRLVEIQEHLCEDDRARDQCLTLAEAWEQHLEDWWLGDRKENSDLTQYLCVDRVKHCCASGHFGPTCQPCPGFPDNICNNNGKCKGNGTRKGDGKCNCDTGYTGQFCDSCDISYYISYKDEKKLLCSKCHTACEGPCTQAGVKGCLACTEGWIMDSERGCLDINECFASTTPCKRNEFCVNNEGSYSCLACDPSCEGCSGDGPDMCDKCANGFLLKDNMCIDSRSDGSYSDTTRYLTYLGLCVATCIIFHNSPVLASGVGLCVALYVTASEYMLGTLQNNNFLSTVLKYFKS